MYSPFLIILVLMVGMFVLTFISVMRNLIRYRNRRGSDSGRLHALADFQPVPSVTVEPRRAIFHGKLSELDVIQHRAHDLAQTLGHAVEFGGSDLLGTFAGSPEVGMELHQSGLDAMADAQPGDALRVQQGVSVRAGTGDAPYATPVRYIVEPLGARDLTRITRTERWRWGMVPRRCVNCGAPNATNLDTCAYCGVRLDGQVRWVVQAVERTGKARARG